MSDAVTKSTTRWAEIGLVAFIFGVLMCMILPLRPWMLDMLLATSISSGLLVMLVIIYLRDPAEFTSFPTLLLIVTLFRLGLNIATTRLILGEAQAGQIIQKFGEVVVQNNYVVGFVVFVILTVINFVVITKGAGCQPVPGPTLPESSSEVRNWWLTNGLRSPPSAFHSSGLKLPTDGARLAVRVVSLIRYPHLQRLAHPQTAQLDGAALGN